MTSESPTARFAGIVAATGAAQIDDTTVARVKQAIIDGLAVGMAGSAQTPVRLLGAHVREAGAAPAATVWGQGFRTSVQSAALVAGELAASGDYDAIACVGAVVRGETPHFDFVAGEAARGIMEVGRETGVPVGYGVITADTLAQAEARSGGAVGNKGSEAMYAALHVASGRVSGMSRLGRKIR